MRQGSRMEQNDRNEPHRMIPSFALRCVADRAWESAGPEKDEQTTRAPDTHASRLERATTCDVRTDNMRTSGASHLPSRRTHGSLHCLCTSADAAQRDTIPEGETARSTANSPSHSKGMRGGEG